MKTKKTKAPKQSKKTSKPARVKQPANQPDNPNGVKVGDRVRCEYQGVNFPIFGNAVAVFTLEEILRVVVEHFDEVQTCHAWGYRFHNDTSSYKVWGAQFVFPISE